MARNIRLEETIWVTESVPANTSCCSIIMNFRMIHRLLTPHASIDNRPLSTSYNNLKTYCEHKITSIMCFRKRTSEFMDIVSV